MYRDRIRRRGRRRFERRRFERRYNTNHVDAMQDLEQTFRWLVEAYDGSIDPKTGTLHVHDHGVIKNYIRRVKARLQEFEEVIDSVDLYYPD